MTIGDRIREARKYRKMTQKQLAEAAEVATGTIQQYELGKREPRYEILIKISHALKISVAALCYPGSTPIEKLTPEAVESEINKTHQFEAYINSLGYELFDDHGEGSLGEIFLEGYSFDGTNDHTLIVDHNRKKLFLLDSAQYRDTIEESLEAYTKFFLDKLMGDATEVVDDGNGGWLEVDPRDEQLQHILAAFDLRDPIK